MKHILKKGIAILLAILCTLNLTVVSFAEETVTSGTCGANASWSFDEVTGTLTISGEGAIEKYIGWSGLGEKIKTLNIKDGITEIGYGAFSDCKSLTEVIIPDSVTVIEGFAFSGCTSLKDVYYTGEIEDWCAISIKSDTTLPASFNLYLNGILVEELVIPDGIVEIGKYLFDGCQSISSVTIPESVTLIDANAFYRCANITNITIPNSVTKIGQAAFGYCKSLTSITIPNSVVSIGRDIVLGSTNLKDVYYTGDIEDWCDISFESGFLTNKSNLYLNDILVEDLVIPHSVTEIGKHTFEGCSSLTSITIHENFIRFGQRAFYDNVSLKKVFYKGSISDWCKIVFDHTSDANPLCNGADLYIKDNLVENAVIPEGVTEIGNYAFNGCGGLKSVILPDRLTKIGYSAFEGCKNLNSIKMPNSVTSIEPYAFRNCEALTYVGIPANITKIEGYLFYGCTNLESVIIPNGVTNIGGFAFANCNALSSIVIPDSVTSISYGILSGCNSFDTTFFTGTKEQWEEITIDSTGNEILSRNVIFNYYVTSGTCGENATWSFDETRGTLTISGTGAVTDYSGWKNFADKVTYVEIGNGITSVGENAFNGFASLKEVYMAESVSELGDNAFAGCSELAIVTALSDTLSFSNAFSSNDSRLFFVAKAGSEACNALKSAGYTVNGISTNREKDGHKVLAFDGKTTVYKNLDYNYISNLISDNMDAHYLYFDKVTFEGIAPDTIIIDEENIDSAEEYFTLNEVYISVSVNGKIVSLPELVELLQNEDADGIISFEQKDAPTIFEIISSFFNEVFEDFVEEANRVIISVINAIKRLFRR